MALELQWLGGCGCCLQTKPLQGQSLLFNESLIPFRNKLHLTFLKLLLGWCFSQMNVHMRHLNILLKCRFLSERVGVEPEILHF